MYRIVQVWSCTRYLTLNNSLSYYYDCSNSSSSVKSLTSLLKPNSQEFTRGGWTGGRGGPRGTLGVTQIFLFVKTFNKEHGNQKLWQKRLYFITKTVDIYTECREMFRNFGLRDGVTTATAATFHISLQYDSDKGLKAMLLQIIMHYLSVLSL